MRRLSRWSCSQSDRREAHDEHEHGQRREDGQLAEAKIAGGFRGGQLAFRAVEEALHQPEHVGRAENHAERGGDGPAVADAGEGARENQELADKAAEHGQADHGQRGDDKEGGRARQLGGQPAVGVDLAGGVAVIEQAEQQEERAVDDAVSEDLVDRAGPAGEGEAVDAESDQAQMAERGKGHQPPEVALHQSETRAVENADDGESDQKRSDGARLRGEEADVEAEHGVEAELAGDDHGERDGRFAEGVGEPAVQREDRNLDGEGEEERERDPEERAGGKSPWRVRVLQVV